MDFTERQAKALKWERKDRLVSAGDGLYLNVRHKSKTWILRRRIKGKYQIRTLGKYQRMSVKEARSLSLQIALEGEPAETSVEQLSWTPTSRASSPAPTPPPRATDSADPSAWKANQRFA